MMWSTNDVTDLENAVTLLEKPSFVMRAANLIGTPIEAGIGHLPESVQEGIAKATRLALDKAMDVALVTMVDQKQQEASNWIHTTLVAATGSVGGFFGAPALIIELPITTTLMLRSIIDTARSEGENINDPECMMACMQVFSLGSPKSFSDDDSDTGYFAARAALAGYLQKAATYLAAGGKIGGAGAPAIVKFIVQIASRFNIVVTEKAALQAVPIVGAAGGALMNTLFINSYQDLARGHFTVRRLERSHGAAPVKRRYTEIAARLRPAIEGTTP